MANKQQVIDLNKKHPGWTAKEIASELDCMPEYVHSCRRRYGLKFARGTHRSEDPNSIVSLGTEARRLGLTIEKLHRLAAGHA